MHTLLVPTDFSENAKNALLYAIALAKAFGSRIVLLHTYQVPGRSDMFVSMDSILTKNAQKDMLALRDLIPKTIPVDIQILKGHTVAAITEYAQQHRISLIVMGTQGKSALEEVFIGSVTGGVMRTTYTPILAIPEHFTFTSLRKIVFAMDGLKIEHEDSLFILKQLAEAFSAELVLFHYDEVNTLKKEVNFELREWLPGVSLTVVNDSETPNVNESIKKIIHDRSADMLCMVRRKKNTVGFFERLFKDSVTTTQIFSSQVPLLILHSHNT